MLSTPNGVGNLFYNIYTESLDNSNGWHNERVDWWEVPGRDEKWRDMTAKALGSVDAFSQEYGNCIAGSSILDVKIDERSVNISIKDLYDLYKKQATLHTKS